MQGRSDADGIPAVTAASHGFFSSRAGARPAQQNNNQYSAAFRTVSTASAGVASGAGLILMADMVFPPFMIIGGLIREMFVHDSEGLAAASVHAFDLVLRTFYTSSAIALTSAASAHVMDWLNANEADAVMEEVECESDECESDECESDECESDECEEDELSLSESEDDLVSADNEFAEESSDESLDEYDGISRLFSAQSDQSAPHEREQIINSEQVETPAEEARSLQM